VLQGEEVRRLVLVLVLILLPGCTGGGIAPEENRLKAACKAFEQYQMGRGYQERKEFLGIAGTEFRAAAFLADSAKYEVLAEYTNAYLDNLGNLYSESSDAIQQFCQDLR
jgi:hypothetical protein